MLPELVREEWISYYEVKTVDAIRPKERDGFVL